MPGQLLKAAEILERVGEGTEPAVRQEGPQPDFDPRSLAQFASPRRRRAGARAPGRTRRRRPSTRSSTASSGAARTASDRSADRIAVDRDAETDLRLDLVALGVGDVAHVVAEAGDSQVVGLAPRTGGPRPRADPVRDVRILPVSDDRLAGDPQAASR